MLLVRRRFLRRHLVCMSVLLVLGDPLNTGSSLALGLCVGNSLNLAGDPRVTLLSPPRTRSLLAEHELNFLESLSTSLFLISSCVDYGLRTTYFGVCEPELDGTCKAESAEDDEDSPADVQESRWDEEADSKVEEPVADGCNTHTGSASLEGPDFCSIDPADGCQGQGVEDDEKIRERDDGMCGSTRDTHDDVGVAGDTLCKVVTNQNVLKESHPKYEIISQADLARCRSLTSEEYGTRPMLLQTDPSASGVQPRMKPVSTGSC